MPNKRSSSSTTNDLGNFQKEIDDLEKALKSVQAKIADCENQADHPVYGQSARNELAALYDQQVQWARRKKALEKNVQGYSKALARRTGSRSGSSRSSWSSSSSRSSKSSQSSKSSASSAPAENGWWCNCGVLNYTDPDSGIICWGCNEHAFDANTCIWELEPHPNNANPWEINAADPMANADYFPE